MAQYKHLPIYKATYDLLAHVTQITKSFPKDFKHSLAARLREECVSLVVYIYKANAARQCLRRAPQAGGEGPWSRP